MTILLNVTTAWDVIYRLTPAEAASSYALYICTLAHTHVCAHSYKSSAIMGHHSVKRL